jgi:hypothetical protein
MATQRYSVTPHPIETLLTWVKSGEIAIPEIQRPFVWDATKVRNLMDSLYQGYPVGYLIAWRNPAVRLKDGTTSSGKRILIDGQQRVTALMAGLLGIEVLTKDYDTVRIRIAFHPVEERFEVSNPAIEKDAAWIPDLAMVFAPDTSLTKLTREYSARNPETDQDQISLVLQKVRKIINNQVGIIELAEDLDIETVTEIFIRVNSAGASLSQADFAMSKIVANEVYGGNQLRKAIDYFCHLAIAPEFLSRIEKGDKAFAASEYFAKMRWLKDVNDDLYDPSYTDKEAQKDVDARWTLKVGGKIRFDGQGKPLPQIALPVFGYKSHIAIDRRFGFIPESAVTSASHADGRMPPVMVATDNTSSEIWADSAYRSEDAGQPDPSAQACGQADAPEHRPGERGEVLHPRRGRACLCASEEPLRAVHPHNRYRACRSETGPGQHRLQLRPADLPRASPRRRMRLSTIRKSEPKSAPDHQMGPEAGASGAR